MCNSDVHVSESTTNTAPILVNPVDHIHTRLGHVFQYQIQKNTFYDMEDGDTSRLHLSLLDMDLSPLSAASWVQFDKVTQVVYGIPLGINLPPGSQQEFILQAKDSQGLLGDRDALKVDIDSQVAKSLNHYFTISYDLDYNRFISDTQNIFKLVLNIGSYLGDTNAKSILVSRIENGSVALTWSNSSLPKTYCNNDAINAIYEKLSSNGRVNPLFRTAMWPKYPVQSVDLDLTGVCNPLVPVRTTSPPDVVTVVTSTDSTLWLAIILPALILILVLLIVACILCYVRRKRRYISKAVLDDEKPIFHNNRKPVLLADEYEMKDANNIPKRPMVLNNDRGYAHQPERFARLPPPSLKEMDRPSPPPYRMPDIDSEYGPMFDENLDAAILESPPPSYHNTPPDGRSHSGRQPPEYRLPPPYTFQLDGTYPDRSQSEV